MTEDAPLKAELIESNTSSVTKEFNIVLGTTLAISLVFLFLSAVFGDAFVNLVADEVRNRASACPYGSGTHYRTKQTGTLALPWKLDRTTFAHRE